MVNVKVVALHAVHVNPQILAQLAKILIVKIVTLKAPAILATTNFIIQLIRKNVLHVAKDVINAKVPISVTLAQRIISA